MLKLLKTKKVERHKVIPTYPTDKLSTTGGFSVGSDAPKLGGKPSKGTKKDKRLKGNKRKRRGSGRRVQ